MKIVQRSINDLIFAEYNPRELTPDQHQQLKDSLTRFGIVDPVIVNTHKDRKDIIVGGHQRTKVWKEMGNKEIPTIEVNLNPEKERELNIRLNKNSGQWDWAALTEHFDSTDLVKWGFEEYQFPENVDYSILDDTDLGEELTGMENGVKKAIQIEFEPADYEQAVEMVSKYRKAGAYIGGILLQHLLDNQKEL